jgi:hypothetical protein
MKLAIKLGKELFIALSTVYVITASNRMTESDVNGRMSKETVVAYFNPLACLMVTKTNFPLSGFV